MASPPIAAADLLYVRHDERADRAVITGEPEAQASPRGGEPKGRRNGMFRHGLYAKRWKSAVFFGSCFDNRVMRWCADHAPDAVPLH
jgi:hypothetical protein